MAKYEVVVDRAACIACGAARAVCPKVFKLGSDNGKNRVVDEYSVHLDWKTSVGVIPEELYECVLKAVKVCPAKAIKIERVE
ncbi:MAG: ferredoxin [Candidatus Verstraetearchaeota archaeon]|jgi:ferredoxin|nr:ferredoxin [Candidatus Verstraetearchaeota archaeon]